MKMSNFINTSAVLFTRFRIVISKPSYRTFLSNAYYCNEVWNSRFNSSILQKINLDQFYNELESGYNKNKNVSAIDVDIFANSVQSAVHVEELLDLVHKLRLSAETSNNLPSTEHAVIRNLMIFDEYDRLLNVLDDRLNYGVFLDNYTANLLLDTFWKNSNYSAGARIASQIMLQEDFSHPLTTYLSLLHCYKFLQKPEGWEEPSPAEEPEEEVKIRVKFLRNEFFDDHFDLKKPLQIVGKTIAMASKATNDSLSKSFELVGLVLQNKIEKAETLLEDMQNVTLVTEILNLLPENNEIRVKAQNLKNTSVNVDEFLENKVKEAERNTVEQDISNQCKLYEKWIEIRKERLEEQQKRLSVVQRLLNIKETELKLKKKETELWFFEQEDKLELQIDSKKVFYPKRWFGKKKKPRQIDEHYIPPEITTTYNKNK